jgi:hypothetical protein
MGSSRSLFRPRSHAQVQMARELGLNPRKLGKIANHRQEPWNAPLPQFIEDLYLKRVGKERTPGCHVGRKMGVVGRGKEGDTQCCSCGRLR